MTEMDERIRRESRMTTFSNAAGSMSTVVHEPTGITAKDPSPIAAELRLVVKVLAYEELLRRAEAGDL